MSFAIRSEVFINATPAAVWSVLVDFPSHAAWDPFLVKIEGTAAVGQRLLVQFNNGMTMRPTVTEVADARVLEWIGSLGVRGIFDGRHRFELTPDGAGTLLVQSELFSGALVLFFKGMLRKTEKNFGLMNAALKSTVEQRG